MSNPNLLSCLGCFWPGNDASGPNQSFAAFVAGLEGEVSCRALVRDPDGTAPSGWQSYRNVPIRQLAPRRFGMVGLRTALTETPHDLLLLNGFHDREFTIPALMMRRAGLVPRRPVILSPRGEFAEGALSLKSRVKGAFRRFALATGLTRDVWLHATTEHEKRDIEAAGIPCRGVLLAPNLRILPPYPGFDTVSEPPSQSASKTGQSQEGEDRPLRMAFVGRVTPVKNIHFALDVLARVKVPVALDLIGPPDDPAYRDACDQQITQLPPHVQVRWRGALTHDDILATLPGYDLFFLPTLGENFGHAINEALALGVPALIADTTPWKNLQEHGAGWDLPLGDPAAFVAAIETMQARPPEARQSMRRAARALAERRFAEDDALSANRLMIETALQG